MIRDKKLLKRSCSNSLVLGDRHWAPHDLRPTAPTLMQRLKIGDNVRNACLNHKIAKSKSSEAYEHYKFEMEMREAWLNLGIHLSKILNNDAPPELYYE